MRGANCTSASHFSCLQSLRVLGHGAWSSPKHGGGVSPCAGKAHWGLQRKRTGRGQYQAPITMITNRRVCQLAGDRLQTASIMCYCPVSA